MPKDVLLVVEVAESSLRYNREIKIPLYARYEVPEAWLVDLQNNRLSLFRGRVAGAYQDVVSAASLHAVSPHLLPNVTLDLSELY